MGNVIMPEDLVAELPLERGDRVLVASDVTTLCWEALQQGKKFDLDRLIDLLQKKIGPEGTLLFPTYNWDFCHGKAFDYRKTRSRTGALGQKALERSDFRRTQHPIYSFAVWGKDADTLVALTNVNSFVGDTPFDYLCLNAAKMLFLNVSPVDSYTFMHYMEERCHVDYRFLKEFTADYIDVHGMRSTRTYTMLVRYLDGPKCVEDNPEQYKWFLERGIVREKMLHNIRIGVSELGKAVKPLKEEIEQYHSAHLVSFVNKE